MKSTREESAADNPGSTPQIGYMNSATSGSIDYSNQVGIGLASPQSIAAALPHMLGFHPHESLLTLWMNAGSLVVLQRVDLPTDEDLDDYVEAYLTAAANIACDETTIVCVTRRPDRGLRVIRALECKVQVRVRAAYIVCGGRVRTTDPGAPWRWISAQDRQQAAETFGSYGDGSQRDPRPIHRTREHVVAEVEYDESGEWLIESGSDVDLGALCMILDRGDLSGQRERRVLRDAAIEVRGRDLVMWWCGRVRPEGRRALLEALLAGLRATPPGKSAHLACAAAAAAWMCGDGVRANAALDRCVGEEPLHSMGRMLEAAMASALPPAEFASMLAEVPPEVVGAAQAVVDSLSA